MRQMKKLITKSNLITLALLALLLWRQLPLFIQNIKSEGIHLPTQAYEIISSSEEINQIDFPPKDSKVIALFWATWCAPCKIDMQRLQTSVTEGKIKPSQIVAISPFEDTQTVKKFLAENKYDFTFIQAPEMARILKVEVTPTTVFLNKGIVDSVSTGLSFIGIWRAELFVR
jgi:cytochrome c biogenesis protein CcmG/thiol:disulfide interchange protein DsbE